MKKIPTLFVRTFENHEVVNISDEITAGCEDAFLHGDATVKFDGACCAIIGGELYKRYDAKKGKKPPAGATPCCDPDPVTGHWPHWVKVDENNPADKWFVEALKNTYAPGAYEDINWTFEAVGPHFQGNPYGYDCDMLSPHGELSTIVGRDFDSIREWLENNIAEGLVFWLNGEPVCKIKRKDFGLPWPVKEAEE